jgi:hypothetical protein
LLKLPPVKSASSYIDFNGGLDLTTPALKAAPGTLRAGSNVEIAVNGGYSRITGYERYSGKAKPSDAVYAVLTCSISGVSLGDVLTDDATTSFGTVIALYSGAAVLTLITGTFSTGNVKVSGVVVGTCTGAQVTGGASTAALGATYTNLAADVYRALIAAVPGSGSVLGVHMYGGNVYAIRNNAGGTAAVMHVASGTGWTAVALGRQLSFTSGGTTAIAVGDTITGATSAATAVITKVEVTSGSWAAGTAAGFVCFASQTGTFQSENLNIGASLNVATIAGNSTANTLAASGRYEFINFNFGGSSATKRMYGASGVHKAFEFDGTVFAFISTGMPTDTPKFITAHKNQLFLSFASSVQHSAPGTPFVWSAVLGGAELACGDDVTGFATVPGSETGAALAIKTKDRTLVLYGNDVSDWNLSPFSEEAGGRAYTLQTLGLPICLDSQGLITLASTQEFGNFRSSVISEAITQDLNALIPSAIASCIVREKNQYRLFFSGGGGYYLTFKGRKLMGITSVDMTDAVTCITSGEGSGGREEIYFGSTDGFVYQMDLGTSFDGEPIPWTMNFAFNHLGSPRVLKSFDHLTLAVEGENYCEIDFTYSLGYGSTDYATPDTITLTQALAGQVNWDAFTWDQFTWDGASLSPSEADVTGTAENISIYFGGNSDEFGTFTLSGAILHYVMRREMR